MIDENGFSTAQRDFVFLGVPIRVFYRWDYGFRWRMVLPYAHKYLNMWLFGIGPIGFMAWIREGNNGRT